MQYRHLVSMLPLLCVGISAQVQAAIYTADFTSSTFDPLLTPSIYDNWNGNGNGSWNITSGGGILKFSSSGSSTSTPIGRMYYSEFLSGDFTATVDIDLSCTSNVSGGLLFTWDPIYGTNISAWKPANMLSFPGTNAIGGWDPVTRTMPTNFHLSAPVTTLQISRSGDIFTESFKTEASNDFVLWHTFDASSWHGMGGHVGLRASQFQPLQMNAVIKYSNFSVSTPVPEPSSYSLALLGLGLVGILARRKAEQSEDI